MDERSWREVLTEANEAVAIAEGQRAKTMRIALDAGLSTRQIASVVGVSASTVLRWATGTAPRQKVSLDGAAALNPQETSDDE